MGQILFQGAFRERPLTEVFELLAHQEITGLLVAERAQVKLEVEVHKGSIVRVSEKPLSSVGTLGEMLMHLGEVTPAQVEQALGQQKRTMQPMGEILHRLFQCSAESISNVLRVQSIECLYNAFMWKRGSYQVESIETPPMVRFEPIDIQSLLLDAIPALNSWSEVKKVLHSSNMVIQRQVNVFPNWEDADYSNLSHQIFELIEYPMTFREISILTGEGQFVVGREILRLLHRGIVSIELPRNRRSLSSLLLGSSVQSFFVWAFMSVFLIGVTSFFLIFAAYSPLQWFRWGWPYQTKYVHWSQFHNQWRMRRIHYALDVFVRVKGYYPKELTQLVELGLLSPRNLYSYRQKTFLYQRTPEGYKLYLQ